MLRLKRLYAHNFKQLQEIELRFPDAARILVQGKNEAGKSTLFEAVFFALFGSALATETGARGLDGLIAYGTEKARVELDVACGARLFKVARTIVRDKPNVWELDVVRDPDPPEEIRGNTAVNRRLIAELGFDGEALLNTCFVEQKKLEKLEGLTRAKREESLAKLLNLDAMVDLENDLKVRAEDKQELERLKKRAELADLQVDLPACEGELASVEREIHLIDLRRAVQGAVTELRAVQQLDAEIADLKHQRDATAKRVESMDALKEAMLACKDARDAAERLQETLRELERLRAEQADTRRAIEARSDLESKAKALRRLARLVPRLAHIRAMIQATGARAEQLSSAQARLLELSATIAREAETVARLESRLREHEIGDALENWIAAKRALVTQDHFEHSVKQKQAARDVIARRFRIEVYGLAALLVFCVVAAALMPALGGLYVALAALTLLALAMRASVLWRDWARASEELGRAEGEVRGQATAGEMLAARLRETEAQLGALGVAVPPTIELAESRRSEIARSIENTTRQALQDEHALARERSLNAQAVLRELQQHVGRDLRGGPLTDAEGIQSALDQCRRAVQKAETIVARWQPIVDESARQIGVAAEEDAIRRALYQIDAQVDNVKRLERDHARLQQEIAQREQQIEKLHAQMRAGYDKASAISRQDWGEWDLNWTADQYTAFGKELRGEYDALGGETLLKQAREIEGGLGRRQGERETRAKNADVWVARVSELVGEREEAREIKAMRELGELEELGARLESIALGDEAELRSRHRQLVGRLHSLRDRRAQIEHELGLEGHALDRAACHAEWQDKARQIAVREKSVELVSLARRRIVQKVLPATLDYMRQILPSLTRDRYHDAQLDPESYKIQVWDERAGGAWKEKNIFSGGTKDQFSLALRLAFALATLPQERGAAPSFIFLDEPLSSFDQERAEALIYLLTEGEIARAFDQIFLISHIHVDERLFTHRVMLENGRVASTDLPAG